MVSRRKAQLAEVIGELEAASAAKAMEEATALCEARVLEPEFGISVAEEEASQRKLQQAEEFVRLETREREEREARAWAEIQEIVRRTKAAHETALPRLQTQLPVKGNRRAQVRHEVDTTATILLVHSGSTLRGHIVDMSANGCHIRFDERFSVGIYTRVETEFRLEGLPFRLGGVIQAVHDPLNVGIRFLDVSQRKREQVDQLIAEIGAIEERPAQPAATEKAVSEVPDRSPFRLTES
jgi:hypothetical protein